MRLRGYQLAAAWLLVGLVFLAVGLALVGNGVLTLLRAAGVL